MDEKNLLGKSRDSRVPPTSELLFDSHQINAMVGEVARKIARLDPRPTVMCPIMTASMVFAADLIRALHWLRVDMEIRPIIYSRDRGFRGYPEGIAGGHILLVDTILDQGRTLWSVNLFAKDDWGARSVAAAVLLARAPEHQLHTPKVDQMIVGVVLPKLDQRFLWGYGLDSDQRRRGCPDIYADNIVPESEMAFQADSPTQPISR